MRFKRHVKHFLFKKNLPLGLAEVCSVKYRWSQIYGKTITVWIHSVGLMLSIVFLSCVSMTPHYVLVQFNNFPFLTFFLSWYVLHDFIWHICALSDWWPRSAPVHEKHPNCSFFSLSFSLQRHCFFCLYLLLQCLPFNWLFMYIMPPPPVWLASH